MDNEPRESSDPNDKPVVDSKMQDAIRMSDGAAETLRDELDEIARQEVDEQVRKDMAESSERILQELNEVNERFKFHQPTPQQIILMEDLLKTYAYLAKMILALCPRCADRTHALRQLQDSKMWANTAIMLEGKI